MDVVEVVRRGKQAYNEGRYEESLTYFHPDIVWVQCEDPLAGDRTFRGHAELRRYWEVVDHMWEGFRSEPEEFIAAGERVIVPSRIIARGRRSGAEVSQAHVEVHTVRDGLIVRRECFPTREEAFAALGLEDDATR